MILLIDNYDSFTYNLAQYLGQLGEKLEVRRNDQITLDEIAARKPDRIVISPGPGTPEDAGICIDVIRRFSGKMPHARRLPRPSGHRTGLRRARRARAEAHARQDQPHPPRLRRRFSASCRRISSPRATTH